MRVCSLGRRSKRSIHYKLNAVYLRYRSYSSTSCISKDDFFVARYDSGHFTKDLPTWAIRPECIHKFKLSDDHPINISVNPIPEVDGCFQLFNVLSPSECDQLMDITKNVLGYTKDAPVSLPYSIRHMMNCNWIVDDTICEVIFQRSKPYLPSAITRTVADRDIIRNLSNHKDDMVVTEISGQRTYNLLGLNNRFRFYKYGEGDYFKPHTDGSWPHSKIVDGMLQDDAYGDGRESAMTFLILLSDGYEGGDTIFYDQRQQKTVNVRTPKGGVLMFFHGMHPLQVLHEGQQIESEMKYMIRTELVFEG